MNEKIKELVDQSGLYIAYDNRAVTNGEIEFFAQMLVKECSNFTDPITRNLMLKHFGIES